jgi:hypothetical protein
MAVNVSMYGKALVNKNQIDLASGSGIVLGWPTQSATVLNNRISGAGDYAMWTDSGSNGNRLIVNNLRGFVPTGIGYSDSVPPAQVLLLSDNNIVIGAPHESGEIVWDLGNNNTVIGMTRRIGQHLPEGQRKATTEGNWMRKNIP